MLATIIHMLLRLRDNFMPDNYNTQDKGIAMTSLLPELKAIERTRPISLWNKDSGVEGQRVQAGHMVSKL
jgi:hypothetical protein